MKLSAARLRKEFASMRSDPIHLFYSYSHEDSDLRDELAAHLALMRRRGLISEWHDRLIDAGREWRKEIDAALQSADIVLLLVSADFIASDYCFGIEMEEALKRQRSGDTEVVPVILRAVDWEGAPFSHLQALPPDAKPVASWPIRDEAWTLVSRGIRRLVEQMHGRGRTERTAATAPDDQKKIEPAIARFGKRVEQAAAARSVEVSAEEGRAVGASLAALTSPKKILWVDDHPSNNEREMAALFALQVEIETVTTTEEALTRIADERPDLIITDWNRSPRKYSDIPEGLRLLKQLSGTPPAIPAIVYHGAFAGTQAETRHRLALESGAIGATASPNVLLGWCARALAARD